MPRFLNILPGDTAPEMTVRSFANPRYVFGSAAGRYLVLCFYGSATDSHARAALQAAMARSDLFDDVTSCFFGVSTDPSDETQKRVQDRYPGYRFFFDFDCALSRAYGAAALEAETIGEGAGRVPLRRIWVILDPNLRVRSVIPFRPDQSDIAQLIAEMEALPPPYLATGEEWHAPVLHLPRVFEPELCAALVAAYDSAGGEPSGFMQQIDGKTRLVTDANHKKRSDHLLADERLIAATRERVHRRIVPQIQKVHQFIVTRMERFLVGCYTAEDGGHFRAHRDNTTSGTAHRRFAVSINLNSDFEGGTLSFPEFGPRQYKPDTGAAVVFSCSLLHQVVPVTAGRRYAFIPFLYDDAAAKIREANNPHLAEGLGTYQAS